MSTATTTPSERLTPKSALRHRPIGTESILEEPPKVPRASRVVSASHPHTYTRPHTQPRAPRRVAPVAPTTASMDVPVWKQRGDASSSGQSRSLVGAIGLGMLLAIIAVLVGRLLIGWIGNVWNDLHYGYPRTYQMNAVVGHHDSVAHPSHFLALNLNGQMEVIEFPGGDVAQATVYVVASLSGPQAALVPVTLHFVQNPQTHHPDMVVTFGGEQVVYRNLQGAFRPPSAHG